MSPADAAMLGRPGRLERSDAPAPAAVPVPVRGALGRLLRSELRLVLGRRRNLVLIGGLSLVPVLLGTVLFLAQDTALGGQGPGFISRVTGNGLFLVVAALFVCLPFLLPLTVGIAAGDAVAGEAATGTLRYLLAVPVGRSRLLAVKAASTFAFLAVAVLGIATVAFVVGATLFGVRDLVLLSGTTIGIGAGVLRMVGAAAYVLFSLTGLMTVGLFFSTVTEVPVGAMAATVATSVVSAVLDTLPQLAAIHPFLLNHRWFDFAEFLRLEVSWSVLGQGLAVQAAWVAVFGTLAWARFTTADITS
jgi:ABC-2 type transport system permease protein